MRKVNEMHQIRYRKARIRLPFNPRKGVCEGCGRSVESGEIKKTDMHHWKYAYATKTVKNKPELALEYTKEYCYHCHQVADALFILSKFSVETVKGVLNSAEYSKLGLVFADLL